MVHRTEHKAGHLKNVTKSVYCKVVPHKDPSTCNIVRIAKYLDIHDHGLVFTFGNPCLQNKVGVNSRARATAVLEAAFIGSCNVQIGNRKIHFMRGLANNKLTKDRHRGS